MTMTETILIDDIIPRAGIVRRAARLGASESRLMSRLSSESVRELGRYMGRILALQRNVIAHHLFVFAEQDNPGLELS